MTIKAGIRFPSFGARIQLTYPRCDVVIELIQEDAHKCTVEFGIRIPWTSSDLDRRFKISHHVHFPSGGLWKNLCYYYIKAIVHILDGKGANLDSFNVFNDPLGLEGFDAFIHHGLRKLRLTLDSLRPYSYSAWMSALRT